LINNQDEPDAYPRLHQETSIVFQKLQVSRSETDQASTLFFVTGRSPRPSSIRSVDLQREGPLVQTLTSAPAQTRCFLSNICTLQSRFPALNFVDILLKTLFFFTMAPELTTTPTRRSALQDISLNAVNKTTAGDACQLGPKASNLEKPSKLVEKSRLIQSVEGAVYGPVCGEARLGGQKRDFGLVESSDRSEAKRFKDKHHIATGGTPGSEVSDMEENTEDLVEPVRHVRPDNPDVSLVLFPFIRLRKRRNRADIF
jgi:hypothetical protein